MAVLVCDRMTAAISGGTVTLTPDAVIGTSPGHLAVTTVVFNVANPDMSVAATTQEIRHRFYGGVEVRRQMGRDETFYAIDKARDLLGYAPRHSWRDVLADPGAGSA